MSKIKYMYVPPSKPIEDFECYLVLKELDNNQLIHFARINIEGPSMSYRLVVTDLVNASAAKLTTDDWYDIQEFIEQLQSERYDE